MLALVGSGCSSRASSASRLVLIDRNLDDFPTSFFGYFPRVVEAHAGDTVRFEQAWTGEPHTVTLGTMVAPVGKQLRALLTGSKPLPEYVDTTEYGLPSIFPETDDNTDLQLNQIAAQPCYVATATLPLDRSQCTTRQPAFDGTQAFYNSGYIRYEGRKSNEFEVALAPSIRPGEYFYYCALHGATMGGFIDVKAPGTKLRASKGLHDPDLERAVAVAKQTRATIAKSRPRHVNAGAFSLDPSSDIKEGDRYPVVVNEFVPNQVKTSVGKPVTWTFGLGPGHTVSFDVPSYIPAITFAADGTVAINPETLNPIVGPGMPQGEPAHGALVDAGNYDGGHFLSSGYVDDVVNYQVTFTKPGTYPYACLIHPGMIGKVIVED